MEGGGGGAGTVGKMRVWVLSLALRFAGPGYALPETMFRIPLKSFEN